MILVKGLVVPVRQEQGLLQGIQEGGFPDVGAGIVDEHAGLHVAVGIDVAVIPPPGNAAAQQPVQCRLQALVGSMRISQGMYPHLLLPPL